MTTPDLLSSEAPDPAAAAITAARADADAAEREAQEGADTEKRKPLTSTERARIHREKKKRGRPPLDIGSVAALGAAPRESTSTASRVYESRDVLRAKLEAAEIEKRALERQLQETNARMSAESAQDLAPMIATSAKILFAFVAKSRGDAWTLVDVEADALGNAWAPALAPYWPTVGQHAPLVVAAITTAGIVATKYQAEHEARTAAPVVSHD